MGMDQSGTKGRNFSLYVSALLMAPKRTFPFYPKLFFWLALRHQRHLAQPDLTGVEQSYLVGVGLHPPEGCLHLQLASQRALLPQLRGSRRRHLACLRAASWPRCFIIEL